MNECIPPYWHMWKRNTFVCCDVISRGLYHALLAHILQLPKKVVVDFLCQLAAMYMQMHVHKIFSLFRYIYIPNKVACASSKHDNQDNNKMNTLEFVNFLLVKVFPTLIYQYFPLSSKHDNQDNDKMNTLAFVNFLLVKVFPTLIC